MPLSTYAELKTAITNFMVRSELSGETTDWITLAEARLNRELNPVEVDTTLTGIIDSREIDISHLSMVAPVSLFIADPSTNDEQWVTPKDFGTFRYLDTTGEPRFWSVDTTDELIIFDRPLDQAYSFRFHYRQKFNLSDAVTTNWLLENYPDIYLAASIVWGGVFTANYEQGAAFKLILDQGMPEVRRIINAHKRAQSTVDPLLPRVGRRVGNFYDQNFF